MYRHKIELMFYTNVPKHYNWATENQTNTVMKL